LLIVVPMACIVGWPICPAGSISWVSDGFLDTAWHRLPSVAAGVDRSAGRFWKSCTMTLRPMRCWWCPGGKAKRIGIAISNTSPSWKCGRDGSVTDPSRSCSRPKKRRVSSSSCFASIRTRSALLDDSWGSILVPMMLPSMHRSRRSFAECVSAPKIEGGQAYERDRLGEV